MLEYAFEEVECYISGYSLFGGVGLESADHREVICRRAADGWQYVGCIPRSQRAGGFIETLDLVFQRECRDI